MEETEVIQVPWQVEVSADEDDKVQDLSLEWNTYLS